MLGKWLYVLQIPSGWKTSPIYKQITYLNRVFTTIREEFCDRAASQQGQRQHITGNKS